MRFIGRKAMSILQALLRLSSDDLPEVTRFQYSADGLRRPAPGAAIE